MANATKRRWRWMVCLAAGLTVCALGCKPGASDGTKREAAPTTSKKPDNKKPVEPKGSVG